MPIRLFFFFMFATGLSLFAQEARPAAKLHGIVTDQQGARIPHAAVRLHPDRQLTKTAVPIDFEEDISVQTDQKGEFSALVPRGLYDVVAFAHVFSPQCAKVRVAEGETQQHDFVLRLDPVVQTTTD
jgi:hypothetical protein